MFQKTEIEGLLDSVNEAKAILKKRERSYSYLESLISDMHSAFEQFKEIDQDCEDALSRLEYQLEVIGEEEETINGK